jgi:hypothetical protein
MDKLSILAYLPSPRSDSFVVTGSLSRLEYGLKWNETFQGGAPIVGDEVTLYLNVELNRQD